MSGLKLETDALHATLDTDALSLLTRNPDELAGGGISCGQSCRQRRVNIVTTQRHRYELSFVVAWMDGAGSRDNLDGREWPPRVLEEHPA